MSAAIELLTPQNGLVDSDGVHYSTDLGNAQRFAFEHGETLRYCPAKGRWLLWESNRWMWDDMDWVVGLAQETVRRMLTAASLIPNRESCQNYASHAVKSMARARIDSMLYLARPHLSVRVDELDCDAMLLNVANGTLDLRTGQLLPHNPAQLITKQSPVVYRNDAQCPTWLRFLDDITMGDKEMVGYLQRAAGYSLTGKTEEHVLFMLFGPGCNGKTTFVETLRYILGDYAKASDFLTFMQNKSSSGPRNDLAMLCGARLVTAAESEDGRQLAESFVKQVTGGDKVTARFLYGEHFEFVPTFKLWLLTNHKPTIRGTDEGIWRRIRLVPFNARIPDDKIDHKLLEKLKAEASGILLWSMEGLMDYHERGLDEPACVLNATSEYRHDEDSIGRFIATRCSLQPSAKVQARRLYEAFRAWAAQGGEVIIDERKFSRCLADRGLDATRTTLGRFWQGICLQLDGDNVA